MLTPFCLGNRALIMINGCPAFTEAFEIMGSHYQGTGLIHGCGCQFFTKMVTGIGEERILAMMYLIVVTA